LDKFDHASGEVDAKLTIFRSSVLLSTAPCQRVITQPKSITDHLTFADSMPHHARARPMRARTCTPPLLCRRHRRHRHLHWQYATTLQLEARRIDRFTLANSLPCHVRARPMRGHARRRCGAAAALPGSIRAPSCPNSGRAGVE
jgi:hypothetical protein